MSELGLETLLTNHARSLHAIGEALLETAAVLESREDADRIDAVGMLERTLVARSLLIDRLVVNDVLMVLIGLLAAKTGVTPREVIEQHFTAAPSDTEWRTLVALARKRRENRCD